MVQRFLCPVLKHLILSLVLLFQQANFSISQALVTDISYANASFYGCTFASFQDTWYTGRNASTYVVDSVIFGQTDCRSAHLNSDIYLR